MPVILAVTPRRDTGSSHIITPYHYDHIHTIAMDRNPVPRTVDYYRLLGLSSHSKAAIIEARILDVEQELELGLWTYRPDVYSKAELRTMVRPGP